MNDILMFNHVEIQRHRDVLNYRQELFKVDVYRKYVEIKRQLDATDDFYCRSYCLLNMFRAPLCPSSGL